MRTNKSEWSKRSPGLLLSHGAISSCNQLLTLRLIKGVFGLLILAKKGLQKELVYDWKINIEFLGDIRALQIRDYHSDFYYLADGGLNEIFNKPYLVDQIGDGT